MDQPPRKTVTMMSCRVHSAWFSVSLHQALIMPVLLIATPLFRGVEQRRQTIKGDSQSAPLGRQGTGPSGSLEKQRHRQLRQTDQHEF